MLRTRTARLALAVALVLLSVFVWPTLYAYDAVATKDAVGILRRHRLTGRVEVISEASTGWVALGEGR